MEWVTLAVGIIGGLGVGGWISGRWERRFAANESVQARKHATAEARASRRFEIRLVAYQEASKDLSKLELWVNLTEPVVGPAPDPPDISPTEEWVDAGGTIAVTASDEVREAMRAATDAIGAFMYAVDEYRRSQKGQKVDAENPGLAMHHARGGALHAIQHAQTVMRDELADL